MAIDPAAPLVPELSQWRSFIKRYLDPVDRFGEILFGLIMALSFTLGADLVVADGKDATTQMLLAILGCNLAWGLIDGGMYIMSCLVERSGKQRLMAAMRNAPGQEQALAMIGDELDDLLGPFPLASERDSLCTRIYQQLKTVPPTPLRVQWGDVYGAIASCWLVFLSALPAVLPFLLIDNRFMALRVSNLLLLTLLFLVGWRWARGVNGNPWIAGTAMLMVGVFMVGIAIALGG